MEYAGRVILRGTLIVSFASSNHVKGDIKDGNGCA
jgi:hypothetical protein